MIHLKKEKKKGLTHVTNGSYTASHHITFGYIYS